MIFGNVSHPLFAANSKGFGVKVDPRFLSKTYCLWYAQSFLRLIHTRYSWWQGYTYKGMNQKRIAVELLAHAVLFYVDTGLLSSSRCAAEISQVLPKWYIKLLMSSISKLQRVAGKYFYDHCIIIDVNYDETVLRLTVFYSIWNVLPTL